MRRRPTLRGRLITSYMAVVAAVVAAAFITVRWLTPTLAQRRFQFQGPGGGGRGPGGPGDSSSEVATQVQRAYDEALTIALIVAAVIGILLALGLAYWVSRQILGRLRDIQNATHRMAAGDYDEHLPEPAEAELADLTKSINSLGAELAATEEARARLVSDLAHELRNPLATIEGYMEGLIDGVMPADAATYSTVADEAHRMKRLTEDLSLLSRAQEGALQLDLEELDIGDVARTVVDRFGPHFQASQVELALHLHDSLPVQGDAGRLNQIITNVIGNALTHTPEGGSVTVEGRRDEMKCRLDITDTGGGISSENLERVFDRFARLDADSGGTGIGLHVSRMLARAHHGELTAHSEGLGFGSTFSLVIPALDR
ncbi:MAG: HAMP domain-containing sensor histidine kinase [Actinomycetota bacterium]|nr:HAMP domain-containing sensor histidine kinase [Actinomycetota bacterium]